MPDRCIIRLTPHRLVAPLRPAHIGDKASAASKVLHLRLSKEAKEDLGGQKSIAAGGMSVVWRNAEQLTKRVQRETFRNRLKRTRVLQPQSQIHCVQVAVSECQTEVPLAGGVQKLNVVTDVVAHNNAVAEIRKEHVECQRLFHSIPSLITRNPVNGDGSEVIRNLQHEFAAVIQFDLSASHRDSSDRDETIAPGIKPLVSLSARQTEPRSPAYRPTTSPRTRTDRRQAS